MGARDVAARLEIVDQRRPTGTDCRGHADQKPARERAERREPEQSRRDEMFRRGEGGDQDDPDRFARGRGDEQRKSSAAGRQDQALDRQLPNQRAAPRAKGRANRQLSAPTDRLHKHQIGDVGDRDDEDDERDAGEPERDPPGGRSVADAGDDRCELQARGLVGPAAHLLGPPQHPASLRLGRLALDCGPEPPQQPHDVEAADLSPAGRLAGLRRVQRDPDVDRLGALAREIHWRHADHLVGDVVERDLPAQDAAVRAERAAPEGVPQDRDGDAVRRHVLAFAEEAAVRRLGAEPGEIAARHFRRRHGASLLASAQHHRSSRHGGQAREGAGPGQEVGEDRVGRGLHREVFARGGGEGQPEADDALGVDDAGRRAQQHPIDEPHHRGVGADAEAAELASMAAEKRAAVIALAGVIRSMSSLRSGWMHDRRGWRGSQSRLGQVAVGLG